MELFIQLFGVVALLIALFSYQLKRRNNILLLQLLSHGFWVIHFLLLGAFTGAALNSAGALRSTLFSKFSSRQRPIAIFILVLTIVVLAALLTWQGWKSLLPMTATIIGTIGFWQRDEQRIRLILLFASPFWFTYNFLVGSYVGMLSDTIVMASIFLALWKYRRTSLSLLAVQKTS